MRIHKVSQRLLAATTLLAARLVTAQTANDDHPHPRPPPEALQACANLASGTDCSFTTERGETRGTCWAPQGKPLACKPAGKPPGGSGPPPQP